MRTWTRYRTLQSLGGKQSECEAGSPCPHHRYQLPPTPGPALQRCVLSPLTAGMTCLCLLHRPDTEPGADREPGRSLPPLLTECASPSCLPARRQAWPWPGTQCWGSSSPAALLPSLPGRQIPQEVEISLSLSLSLMSHLPGPGLHPIPSPRDTLTVREELTESPVFPSSWAQAGAPLPGHSGVVTGRTQTVPLLLAANTEHHLRPQSMPRRPGPVLWPRAAAVTTGQRGDQHPEPGKCSEQDGFCLSAGKAGPGKAMGQGAG